LRAAGFGIARLLAGALAGLLAAGAGRGLFRLGLVAAFAAGFAGAFFVGFSAAFVRGRVLPRAAGAGLIGLLASALFAAARLIAADRTLGVRILGAAAGGTAFARVHRLLLTARLIGLLIARLVRILRRGSSLFVVGRLAGAGLVLLVFWIATFGSLLTAGLRLGRLILGLLVARLAGRFVALARLAAGRPTGLIVAAGLCARLFTALIAGRFAALIVSALFLATLFLAALFLATLFLTALFLTAGLRSTHRILAGLLARLAARGLLTARLLPRLVPRLLLSAWLLAARLFAIGRGLSWLLTFSLLTLARLTLALWLAARWLTALRLLCFAVAAWLLTGLRLSSRLTAGLLLAIWLLPRLGLTTLRPGLWLAALSAGLRAAGLVLAAWHRLTGHRLAGLIVGLAGLTAGLRIGGLGLSRPLGAQWLFVLAARLGLVRVLPLIAGAGWRLIALRAAGVARGALALVAGLPTIGRAAIAAVAGLLAAGR